MQDARVIVAGKLELFDSFRHLTPAMLDEAEETLHTLVATIFCGARKGEPRANRTFALYVRDHQDETWQPNTEVR